MTATRRQLLAGGIAALMMPALGRVAEAAKGTCGVARTLTPDPQRAISLRALSNSLAIFEPTSKKYKDLLLLNGITRLDGYVLDKENHDIILWGIVEKGAPPLHLEDFIVALRNAHAKYIVTRDGKKYFMAPAISIDPDPKVMKQLHEIDLNAPNAEAVFRETCAYQQKVRVEGMPWDCRAAMVLVDADYRMKQVSQGTYKLKIKKPFPSLNDVRWNRARAELKAGVDGKIGSNSNRFWFEAGKFAYQVSDEGDTIFLDTAQVVLRDEQNRIDETGAKLVATGDVDQDARDFSCAWSDRMEDTYASEPVWRDMHNIFRHFAVARILREREALRAVQFRSNMLLDDFRHPLAKTPKTLTGLGRFVHFTHKTKRGRTTWTTGRTLTVCGGVSVGFTPETLAEQPDEGLTKATGQTVVAARPSLDAVSWQITGGIKALSPRGPKSPVAPKAPDEPSSPLRDILKKYS